jgi:hypothetical protein
MTEDKRFKGKGKEGGGKRGRNDTVRIREGRV